MASLRRAHLSRRLHRRRRRGGGSGDADVSRCGELLGGCRRDTHFSDVASMTAARWGEEAEEAVKSAVSRLSVVASPGGASGNGTTAAVLRAAAPAPAAAAP